MNSVELLEHISEPNDSGLLKIKAFARVNYEQIKSVVVYQLESVNLHKHGHITFHDDVWRDSANSVNFSQLTTAMKYEVKSAFFLANYSGLFEGGVGKKFASVRKDISPLIRFCEALQNYGIDSIHDFNSRSALYMRNIFGSFIKGEFGIVNSSSILTSQFFSEFTNYGLFTPATLTILNEEIAKLDTTSEIINKTRSYPIVPSGLLKKIIGECIKKFAKASLIIDEWEAANDVYVQALRNAKDTGIQYKNASSIVNKRRSINRLLDPLRDSFKVLDNLKLHVFLYILAYTGMRKEEALSCHVGCSGEHDGKYYIEALLTKTDETSTTMKWVANRDTHDAITILERYVKGMHKRAIAILDNPQIKITDALKHQLTQGLKANILFGVIDSLSSIKFSDANLGNASIHQTDYVNDKEPKFSLHKFAYSLTAQDIDQLESLNCNYKAVRGNHAGEKYVEGDVYHITPHMLRHNFAWFIVANRLGQLDDIKHQFKHLASSMTMVYASRGFESPDEMIGLFEDFEELLVNNIAQDIAFEASEGSLTGEGGKRLNNGAKSLIFNVTASEGSVTGRTIKQIHFKSLDAYKAFLAENLKNIRGLPHGYCTAGPACKLKNVGLPSGCVYCPSYVVTKQQKVHWQAMKNFADEKLGFYNQLSPDKQSEYALMAESWRDTSNAASVILTDRTPLKIDGDIA